MRRRPQRSAPAYPPSVNAAAPAMGASHIGHPPAGGQRGQAVVEDALGPPDVIEDNGGRSYHLGRCLGLRTRLSVLYLYFGMGERLNQATVMHY